MSISVLWRRSRRIITYAVLFTGIVWIVQWEYIPPGTFGARLDSILRGSYYDFVNWEATALVAKVRQQLTTPQDFLDDAMRKQIVLDYLDLVTQIHQVEGEIARIYTDPNATDAEAASIEQRATLDQLRADQARVQGTAESILEEQIASVLADEGFRAFGEPLPPVRFHFTPLPRYVVISPRSEVMMTHGAFLRGDIELDRIEDIESQIDEGFDVSSLVVPIGGFALWPAMMQETSSLTWTISATSHEWVHHFFFFWLKPLGLHYDTDPDVRIINETAAEIAGAAIGNQVLARYYPESLPPPTPTPDPDAPPPPTPEPPEFDFVAEMRETRINTDRLLAEGEIEEAESYMEQRRRFFVEHGYNIRKLNQAFFAWHGAYDAAEPGGGAAGDNPVGIAMQQLWAASPSIKDFLDALAPVTSREKLLTVLAEKGIEYQPPTSDQN